MFSHSPLALFRSVFSLALQFTVEKKKVIVSMKTVILSSRDMILFSSVALGRLSQIPGGFITNEWMWIRPKACVTTATRPSGNLPAAAVLQLFACTKSTMRVTGWGPPHHRQMRWLSFILGFRRSWWYSMHCRFRLLISFLKLTRENVYQHLTLNVPPLLHTFV